MWSQTFYISFHFCTHARTPHTHMTMHPCLARWECVRRTHGKFASLTSKKPRTKRKNLFSAKNFCIIVSVLSHLDQNLFHNSYWLSVHTPSLRFLRFVSAGKFLHNTITWCDTHTYTPMKVRFVRLFPPNKEWCWWWKPCLWGFHYWYTERIFKFFVWCEKFIEIHWLTI